MYSQEDLLKMFNIPEINPERQYWLVRTDGGNLWEQFKVEGFIGIGWNEFSDKNKFKLDDNQEKEILLKEEIRSKYETDKPGTIINPIRRFMFDMKIGDIIMIPSEGSNIITFGEISSDFYLYEMTDEDIDEEKCDYIKRRNFKFLKEVNRPDLDPILFKMFQAHQVISSANNYASVIDRTLESIYIKDGISHLKIDVKTKDPIKGKSLYMLQKLIFDELDVSKDVDMKINVQSPGFLEFISNNIWNLIFIILGINVIIGGGKMFGFEVPGIMNIFSKRKEYKRAEKQQQFEQHKEIFEQMKDMYGEDLKKLHIETPNPFLNQIVEIETSLNQAITSTEDDES